MNFSYLNDTTIVIKLSLPDTLGSYQITYNPKKHLKSGHDCGCSKPKPPVGGPRRPDIFTSHKVSGVVIRSIKPLNSYRPGSANVHATITAVFNPGGEYVTGLTMSGQYVTDNGKTGVVQVVPEDQEGVFTYSLPNNPAPPPPCGFSEKVKFLLNALCWVQAPKGLTREGICGEFYSTGPSIGSMACETML
ncbi:MAG: hypothetical protein NTW31_01225, partial [Bacteroidetes bacterium]|nr:hypothetical protein [Bacteroidota bacterium]